MTEMFQW